MSGAALDLEAFCNLRRDDMARWLSIAMEEYFYERRGRSAFVPFALDLDRVGSPAEALAGELMRLRARVREEFCAAVALCAQRLGAEKAPAWLFLAELSLLLDAVDAVSAFEKKWNDHFLRQMENNSPGIIEDLLIFVRPINPAHQLTAKPLTTLVYRLALSGFIDHARAGVTLMRLCEIDADEWTTHINRLRSLTYTQMRAMRDAEGGRAMLDFQDELATTLLELIGIERFAKDLHKLTFGRDAPDGLPTDNWLWRALVERTRLVEPVEGGFVVLSTSPAARVAVPNALLTYLGDMLSGSAAEDHDEDEVLLLDAVEDFGEPPLDERMSADRVAQTLGSKSAPLEEDRIAA